MQGIELQSIDLARLDSGCRSHRMVQLPNLERLSFLLWYSLPKKGSLEELLSLWILGEEYVLLIS